MIIHFIALALAAAVGIAALWEKSLPAEEKTLCFLVYFLPFLGGGFSSASWAVTICALLLLLGWFERRRGKLAVPCNDTFLTLLLLTVCSGISVFWAVDRGMAVWGIIRYVPVVLFGLVLVQLPPERRQKVWMLVPLSGVVMTILSGIGQYFPEMAQQYTVAGRLAGFFEYPNTFAAYLLTGLVISVFAEDRNKRAWLGDTILICGVLASGSRTVFLMMIVVLLLLVLLHRKKKAWLGLLAALLIGFGAVAALSILGHNHILDRLLSISLKSSTFLGRLLYFRDALPVIRSHPLGLGYMGYHALQGSFQTGVYSVAHVHNGILQLFLDVGWVPAIAMIYVFLRGFFQKGGSHVGRLVMLVLLGHSLFDFDMEFLPVWLVLLPALHWEDGVTFRLRGSRVLRILGVLLAGICLWLAAGDSLFRAGKMDLALKVTPFHTQALEYRLTQLRDAEELDAAADRLLNLNSSSRLGHSAKANAAYASGDVAAMVAEKKTAIRCARYDLEEYCDYFRKLNDYLLRYREQGDSRSAEICASLLLEIPGLLEQVRQETTSQAWMLDDVPQLELPAQYQKRLAEIASLYTVPAK